MRFELSQNYPNPFNPSTSIVYTVPAGVGSRQYEVGSKQYAAGRNIRLAVYDMLGREVAVLVNEAKQPGTYSVRFDGSNLSTGVYFYRLTAGSNAFSKKMLLIK